MDTTITTLEFCTGYGGIGLGLKNIFGERLRCLAYCELEGFAQANIVSKMEAGLMDVAPLWSDLKTFPYGKFHGLVDILITGYPCQPFSAAGKRAGKDDPRHLWPWIADGIRLLQPRACFFENVEGHISLGLSTVVSDLEEMGYKVSWGIFSASEIGAPHQRKRVFILAHRIDQGSQGWIQWGEDSQWESVEGHIGCGSASCGVWPSRPGEPQHGWEPPRVVANSKLIGRRGGCDGDEGGLRGKIQTAGSCSGRAEAMGNPNGQRPQERTWEGGSGVQGTDSDGGEEGSGQIKSEVGGDTHGTTRGMDYAELFTSCDNRTDELRLLGNGVVPATAERAFRVLMEEITK